MKTLPLIFVLASVGSASVGSASAGSVTLSSATGSAFTTSAGAALPAGAIARVGSFSLSDAALASTSDYAKLNAAFKPLAEAAAASGTITQANGLGTQLRVNGFPSAGHVFGTITGISSRYVATGTQLYVWVFDAGDARTSSQWGIFKSSTWQAPPELGAQTLSTTDAIVALQGSVTTGQLRLAAPASTFGNWSMKHFAANASASVTAFNADPDGDGLHNLAEYAWQLDPTTRSTGRTTLASGSSGAATFTFKTPKHLPDVAVTAECSSDLTTWGTASSSITASDEDFDTRTCTSAPGAHYFWRVRFSAMP